MTPQPVSHTVDNTQGTNVPRWHAALTSIINAKEETDTAPLLIIQSADAKEMERWPERDAAVSEHFVRTTTGKSVKRKKDYYKGLMLDTAIGTELSSRLQLIIDSKLNGPEAMARKDTLRRKINYGVETMKRAKDCVVGMERLRSLGFTCKIDKLTGKDSKSFRPFLISDSEGRQEYFSVPQLGKAAKLGEYKDAIVHGTDDQGKPTVVTNVQHLKSLISTKKGPDDKDGANVNFKNWKDECLPAVQGLVNYFDDDDRVKKFQTNKMEQDAFDEVYTLHASLSVIIEAQEKLGMKHGEAIEEPPVHVQAAANAKPEGKGKGKGKGKGPSRAH